MSVPENVDLEALLKRLHLANARRIYRDLIERAEKEQWSFHDFLCVLAAEEVAHRQQTRIQRLTHRARFPFLKTIDDFDFTYQSTLRLALLGSALSPDFVTEGRSLVLHGKPGRGKTHLAIAIAYRAIQNGFDVCFVTAAKLIDDLSRASRDGRLTDALAAYTHPHVLVIDEVGYLAYGDDAANVLFHVVNDRHLGMRSMIFTTNKRLADWGHVLHDKDLAAAIVDRILERGRLISLDGPSLRTRHLGLDDAASAQASNEPARISGIDRQEFPEPTVAIQPHCRADFVLGQTARQQLTDSDAFSPKRLARRPSAASTTPIRFFVGNHANILGEFVRGTKTRRAAPLSTRWEHLAVLATSSAIARCIAFRAPRALNTAASSKQARRLERLRNAVASLASPAQYRRIRDGSRRLT